MNSFVSFRVCGRLYRAAVREEGTRFGAHALVVSKPLGDSFRDGQLLFRKGRIAKLECPCKANQLNKIMLGCKCFQNFLMRHAPA